MCSVFLSLVHCTISLAMYKPVLNQSLISVHKVPLGKLCHYATVFASHSRSDLSYVRLQSIKSKFLKSHVRIC